MSRDEKTDWILKEVKNENNESVYEEYAFQGVIKNLATSMKDDLIAEVNNEAYRTKTYQVEKEDEFDNWRKYYEDVSFSQGNLWRQLWHEINVERTGEYDFCVASLKQICYKKFLELSYQDRSLLWYVLAYEGGIEKPEDVPCFYERKEKIVEKLSQEILESFKSAPELLPPKDFYQMATARIKDYFLDRGEICGTPYVSEWYEICTTITGEAINGDCVAFSCIEEVWDEIDDAIQNNDDMFAPYFQNEAAFNSLVRYAIDKFDFEDDINYNYWDDDKFDEGYVENYETVAEDEVRDTPEKEIYLFLNHCVVREAEGFDNTDPDIYQEDYDPVLGMYMEEDDEYEDEDDEDDESDEEDVDD